MTAPVPRPARERISRRVVRVLRGRKPLWRFLEFFCRAAGMRGAGAYLVGGFVRDLVERRRGKDIDLMVTGITFERLGEILRTLPAKELGILRIVSAGKSFAVYKVRTSWAEEAIDVALARGKNRSAREDAACRDLTINSLLIALRADGGRTTGSVIDFFGGLGDLRRKLLRGVGNPEERFREDPLRLLRAIRQKNERRGYSIEKKTWAAIRRTAPELVPHLAGERVIGELLLSLSSNPRGAVEDLRRAGILRILLPEVFARDRGFSRVLRRFAVLERSPGRRRPLPEILLLANLLVDVAQAECDGRLRTAVSTDRPGKAPVLRKEDEKRIFRLSRTETIARRLHIPQVRAILRMLEDLARLTHAGRMKNPRARIEAIFERWESPEDLLALYRADCRTSGRKESDLRGALRKAARVPQLLSGKDLAMLGIPGARREEILAEVREATLTGRVKSRKEGIGLVLSIHGGGTAGPAARRGVNPRARRAETPEGSPPMPGREAESTNSPGKNPRRSPIRPS